MLQEKAKEILLKNDITKIDKNTKLAPLAPVDQDRIKKMETPNKIQADMFGSQNNSAQNLQQLQEAEKDMKVGDQIDDLLNELDSDDNLSRASPQ